MALARFVDDLVVRVRAAPVDLALLPPEGVPGSLYSGAAGVAFFLHEVARLRGDDALLEPARRWLEAAEEWARHATRQDWHGLTRGFLIGATGLAYVDALLSARTGDAARALAAIERIERTTDTFDDIREGDRPTELVGGVAGLLCATRDLDARLPRTGDHDASRAILDRVRASAIETLLAANAEPFVPGPHDRLGLAHGRAGELWALVGALGPDHEIVRARLGELAALREIDEEGLAYWLPSAQSDEFHMFGTWCNGMAGHALLWSEVARRAPGDASLGLARLAAESSAVLRCQVSTVCCGLAGHAAGLQRYADVSGDARFGRRAYDRLAAAAKLALAEGDERLLGLWQGAIGVALVATGRLHGEASFPLIEPLRTAVSAAGST